MTYNEFLKKYGFAPAQSGAEPASVSGGKSSMSYSQLLRKHNVPDEGKLLQQQMRDTGYLTDTPVGNTKKYETKQTVSSDTLRAQLNEINARIDQYSKKAADAENEAWLASISNITHETPVRTAQQAEDRRQYSLSMVDLYKKQRDKVTAQLDEAVYSEYMDLANKGDFATRSQYKSTATGESENLKNGYVSSAFTDPVYDYINGIKEAEGFIALQESKTGAKALGFDKTKYSQMTADEVAVYNYLYSQSKEKADEFLKTMEKKLATRQGAAEAARIDAEPNAVKRGVAKAITAAQSGLDSSLQGLAQSMTDEVLPKSQLSYTGEAVKETTSGVGRFIYDSVELVSHMVPSILTSYAVSGAGGALATTAQGLKKAKTAGQLASSLVTAVSAAGNSYAEQVEKGLTKQQSKTIAALIGASEGGLQYLLSGVGAMGGKLTNNIISNKIAGVGCGLARVGLKLVASGVSEAIEEVLQLYVEPAVIAAVTGDAYDAPTRAEVIYTALLSAVSAGLFEGGAIVADETNTRRAGNIVLATDSVRAVIDDAAASENKAMQRLADKLTKRLEEGKKITAYDLGRIVAESANPDALIQAPEETVETQTETAEIPSAIGETMSPTQAPERQTTPLQTETRTTVAEDGTTKVELPKVINREEQTRAAQKANDPYVGVPEYSPSGLKYTELERSGIAAGAAESVVETAKRISAITKRRILFYDGNKMTGDWARANGAYDNNTIYVNSRSANPVAQIIAHEMTHSIEGTGSYTSFGEYVLNYMAKQGNDLDAMRAAKRKLYGRTDAEFDVDAELVAEFVEKNLLTNEAEIAKMVRSQPSLGRAILNWINGMIAKLPGAKAARERDFLIRARDMYSKALSEAQKRSNEGGEDAESKSTQFAFAGKKALTADLDALAKAAELEQMGDTEEEIFRETGWFRGADGKWRFEIDDSSMRYRPSGDALMRQNNTGYAELKELELKFIANYDEWTDADQSRFNYLREIYGNEPHRLRERVNSGNATLEDILEHDALFAAYPELRDTKIKFADLEGGTRGTYSRRNNTITLNKELKNKPESTLLHEIQHAIQNVEGFSGGASPAYWARPGVAARTKANKEVVEAAKKKLDDVAERLDSTELTLAQKYVELTDEYFESDDDPELYRQLEEIERLAETHGWGDLLNEYIAASGELAIEKERQKLSPLLAYQNTAGEIEARDASVRRNLTAEMRRESFPDTGDENTLFADESDGYFAASAEEQESIRKQLRKKQSELNSMSVVGKVNTKDLAGLSTGDARKKLVQEMKKTGYRVDRQGFGEIRFEEAEINNSLNYKEKESSAEDARRTGFLLLKNVLKRGIEISERDNHKGRNYGTVTIAAPVEINGVRGNMAVVVKQTSGNRYKVHRILTPSGETFSLPEMANAEKNTVGAVIDNSQLSRGSTPAINSASKNNITDNIDAVNAKFSISSEPIEQTEQAEEKAPSFASFPKKSQKAINSNENRLLNGISELLSVPFAAKRDSLKGIVRQITDIYLENGMIPADKADELFETAYDKGIVVDDEYYNTYKHVKDYLRKTPVVLRAEYRSDMGDYEAFRKAAFGLLNLNKAATRGVDQVYMDLIEMAPKLFPEDIMHPADQLQRMYEVANGIRKVENTLDLAHGYNAKEFKEWARQEFNAKLQDYTSDLNLSKRYAESRAKKVEKPVLSAAEASVLYKELKPLKRELEKAVNKNLLTDEDKKQVDRLVRGDILLKHLDPETDNVRGITEVYEVALKYEEVAAQLREYKRNVKAAKIAAAQEIVGTTTDWEDRKTGIGYSRQTAERNSFKVIKDPKKAKVLNEAYFKPVHDHEKDATDFKNKYRGKVRSFNLSRKVEKGNTVSESHAVQLLGEAEDNVKYLKEAQRRSRGKDVSSLQRDGKTLADWEAVIENLWITNPNLDKDKITKAVEEFRTIYDELFKFMNEVRVRNGYEPVSYRRGYFPHFQANEDGLLAAFGKALGISTDVVALPTSINGLTHMFKPGIKWFGNALERLGYDTTYDAVHGFDKYIEGVADVIYHTDDIQNLRALASYIRYASGDDGLREQADAIRANPEFDEETKEEKIKKLYEDGRFALNKYVVWLEEYTNLLAGKKSRNDRQLEDALNRQIYNAAKNLESRVAANMISLNVPSWLTNFIPLTQASALVSTSSLLKGMGATLKAYKSDDGMVSRSTFLTNRRGSDPLVQTWAQKASAALGKGMEIIDTFTADSIVRARYYDNIKKGLSEDAAMSEADSFAASVMADRSKGSTPTLFQQKNPVTKLFTQFQLEVNNQLSYLLKDIPRENREKGIAALAMSLLKFMVGAWLYNEVYEFVIGRRPALDVLGILNDTVGDITGYELPNLVKLGAGAISGELPSFETEKGKVGANLVTNILEEVPFTTVLNLAGIDVDSGRYPMASAIPDITKIAKAFGEGVPSNKRTQTLVKELGKPAAYILPPFGGGQIKKLVEAIATVSRGGSYTIDNEGNKILQYPVYRDTTYETLLATMGAAIFGKTTLKTGQEWVESGFKSLSAKDTAVYQVLVELGENEKKSYQFIKDIKAIEGTEDVSKADLKRKFLAESNLSDAAKSAIYYSMLATDKELEVLTPLLGDDEKMVEAVNAMLNVHTTGGSSAKMLDIATEAGVSYDVAAKLANELAKLEPQNGKKSVTGLQKWRVAVDLAADEKEASALLKATMSDSQYERYENAVKQTKISSTMYIKGLELLSAYGSTPSNDEVTAAIQDMASNRATLPAVGKASGNLTDEQRAILWQMWTGSTSVKNNPWASKNDKALKAAEKIAAENNK